MSAELPNDLHERIKALSAEGDVLAEQGRHRDAIARYDDAWKLIPDPKLDWEASTWVLAALGDSFFFEKQWDGVCKALEYAVHCPGGFGNPFIHLRLGQAKLELGEEVQAADELMRAYMGGGAEIFASDDAKYLAFLKTRANIDA
ncbi:MAG: tol-pal system YbgF family protein [Hyphomonadaceae bacterium]